LAETFGRGAMTNHWNDIANADCILVIGGNPAENHPAAFGHITKAMQKGVPLVVVDPRITRSAAKADIYAPMRSGTDIAFTDGMIKYVMDDIEKNPQNYNLTYITEYTNASYLVNPDFKGPVQLDGLFSDYAGVLNETDNSKRKYNKSVNLNGWQTIPETWSYKTDSNGVPLRDKTLKDPNCVYQIMKREFAAYTPEQVNAITGTPADTFLKVCQTYASTGQVGKSGTILYAMGTTQHTYGTQNIRSYTILQLLLGNIGLAGGGINAMRGESNVQGSTDHCLLFHILPGYLKVFQNTDTSLDVYLKRVTPTTDDPLSLNWWSNTPKYVVSLLKTWYGDAATKDNQFGYHYLPKIQAGVNYSWIPIFENMVAGKIKGCLCWGQNPAVGGPDSNLERQALGQLDWLVVTDIWHTETSDFWERPGVNPADIKTEVFLLPALNSFEKEGSVTNSGRWSQWRYKAADGPPNAEEDSWMLTKLAMKLKDLYSNAGGPNAEAITNLTWDYGDPPDARSIAKEINGYDLTTGKLLDSFTGLKDDGTTTSGNWLYCNSYVEPDKEPDAPIPGNRASLRSRVPGPFDIELFPKWAWSWPVNRRIIYNRASVDLDGNPWEPNKPVIEWDASAKKWIGDVPDGGAPPMNQGGYKPFIMLADGLSHLFGPGLADGPLPVHYEPWESPIQNPAYKQQSNPAFYIWRPAEQASPSDFPIVATTYRVCEMWLGGQMTRNSPWLVEMMPEPFIEISEELAADKGIANGDYAIVTSTRGQVRMKAVVTKRFKPFQMNGTKVHQIGVVYHWGYVGLSTGDSGNILTPEVGDANTMIPEYKAFLCNVSRG
jgi:formate dehydrogenase-N alpha subunit